MNKLMTIGYESASLDDFIGTLASAGVTTVLDVRELPLSRRKGFSKNALAEVLRASGIEYRHERDLGSPRPIRHQLQADGNYATYFAAFNVYLGQQQQLLRTLVDELTGAVALMCFERDPLTCHRSVVAKQMGQLSGLKVSHLGVMHGASKGRKSADRREGVPAA